MPDLTEVFGPVISAYTRAQAIEDGTLIDVSETAREAGIRFPVAVTRAVWAACVEVPKGCEGVQDEAGRLWDVVFLLRFAVRASRGGSVVQYPVTVVTGQRTRVVYRLKAVCGPGDQGEPVITVMFPEED
jgi:hypothetical protein